MADGNFEFLRERLNGFVPDTAVVLGSGLGNFTNALQDPIVIPYEDIPGCPTTHVPGHKGGLYAGVIGKHNVICLAGRTHLYEGLDPRYIAMSTRDLKELGVKRFIATNAAGSLRVDMPAGSLMMITDHINFSGRNPLVGFSKTPSFPDMSAVYNPELCQKVRDIAKRENIELFEGVYAMALGPNFETPAEVKMFRTLGADAVGMSTVPEVITAINFGLEVLGFSIIANLGAGLTEEYINHQEVLDNVAKTNAQLTLLLKKFMEEV
ncbi:MAG: purine-nucleoside phosphorylase [Alphaproteobacteria bacterium]|nr:purine-nucleoside phosphorylase [Alphaproteobacteria bacterium]